MEIIWSSDALAFAGLYLLRIKLTRSGFGVCVYTVCVVFYVGF